MRAQSKVQGSGKIGQYIWYGFVAIAIGLPFHAFTFTWLGSFAPSNLVTPLRYWKELILLGMAVLTAFLLIQNSSLRQRLSLDRFAILFILLTALHGVILAIFGAQVLSGFLALKINLGFLALYLILTITQLHSKINVSTLQSIVLIPAGIAGAFGVLQAFVLPRRFLTNFGYGEFGGINPAYSLVENTDTIRVIGTLWGPNQFGSYLVLPITLAFWLLFKGSRNQRLLAAAVFVIDMLALYATHSRGAWLAVAFSLIIVVALLAHGWIRILLGALGLGLVATIIILATSQKLPSQFNDLIIRGDANLSDTTSISSNDGHIRALELGIDRLNQNPLGAGLEAAGRASEDKSDELYTENFFLQLAVQVGYPGFILFIIISGIIIWRLMSGLGIEPLSLPLLASFVGLSINNLVAHTWSDGATAWIWWGLAGIIFAQTASHKGAKRA